MSTRTVGVIAAGLALCFTTSIFAGGDQTPTAPRGEFVPYAVQSELAGNEAASARVVFTHMVGVPTASWIRLYFSEVDLEGASFVRLTSMLDGQVQTLDTAAARLWDRTSAYFNGDRVLVELVAAPGTSRNRIALERVALEYADHDYQPEGASGQCGICGNDDRVLSNDNWAGRLMPVGCTASVYNTCSCLVSAGHCMGANLVIQFNVPSSQSNCALMHPPVDDQFPITNSISQSNGVGADWAVLKAGTNGVGQTPYRRYEQLRRFASAPPAIGNSIGFAGFGIDITCTNNQRQQFSIGQVNSVFSKFFDFTADIRGGNSGSSVIRNGEIIGIVTHCTIGCPNKATRWDLAAFVNARNSLCPPCAGDVVCTSQVNVDDLVAVISNWGPCPGPCPLNCATDIAPTASGDCQINVDDLVTVLEGWGACP